MRGDLYLIPVTLGNDAFDRVLPPYNLELIREIKFYIVEEVRTARRFLKSVDPKIDIDELTFSPMGKHAVDNVFETYLNPIEDGHDVGVLSEAGCPAIADPGSLLVEIAQRKHIRVVPLVGPSSILLSLMASGFNGQCFAFHGYLPIDPSDRIKMIKQIESRIYQDSQTQIFIETPFRNDKMLATLLKTCRPCTKLCIATNITCQNENIRTKTIQQWRDLSSVPSLNKMPTVFLLYK